MKILALLPPVFLITGGWAAARPADPATKTHHLFMGSNLTVVSKNSALPVKDVKNNSFVVHGPGGDEVIATQNDRFQLRIDDALKLTSTFATVEDLVIERTYSPGNDPMKKFTDAARTGAYLAENSEVADSALRNAETGIGMLVGTLNTAKEIEAANPGQGGARLVAQAEAQLRVAEGWAVNTERDAVRAQSLATMDAFSSVSTSNRLNSEIAAEAFDAVRVTFKISSLRPLATPYAVIFMRFLTEKDRPDTANIWVYAEKLPDIGEHPRHITILRGGFPPGYHIDSHHVHLYEGTAEIATSVSRKQVALTTDEAFQFSVIQHINGNRDRTKGPTKAGFFWPGDLASRLLPDKLRRTIYVRVGKLGQVHGIFEDEACQQPVGDPDIAQLAPELRFFPALDKGKPVEGIAAVTLGPRP
jgi:hypothetical protein